VFYDGSHSANLKLLKIRGLIDACITKIREVTKARNFFDTYVRIRELYTLEAILVYL
jgi:hypothetical protein